MANLKISQLTTYTGTSADLRWFVMNNSGETETFKFSGYTSPFRYVNDTLKNGVLINTDNSNLITSTGSNNLIGAGITNTISSNSDNSFIGGGNNNTITHDNSAIIGGQSNSMTNNQSAIIASESSTNGGIHSTIMASQLSVIGGTLRAFIGATYECRINNGIVSSIIGGYLNILNANSYASILNGYDNQINGGNYNQIFNGESNRIGATSTNNIAIIGGNNNNVNNNSSISSIISSTNSTINGRTQAVMIGTSGRTASQNYATHVENLVVFNYASLNFADDTAAAAGGVVLGQIYHNAGALRIRIV